MAVDTYTQMEYINLYLSGLKDFREVKGGRFEFRCPFCGDSKSSKRPKAGMIISNKSGSYVFHCHKCSETRSFVSFLGHIDPEAKKKYLAETASRKVTRKSQLLKGPKYPFTPRYRKRHQQEPDSLLLKNPKSGVTLKAIRKMTTALPKIGREYMKKRGVSYEQARFTEDVAEFYKTWSGKNAPVANGSRGIVLPCLNEYGKAMGFVIRNLDAGPDDLRYLAYNGVDGIKLVFGIDRVTDPKSFWVMEGSFDALSVDNAIAVLNGDLAKTVTGTLSPEACDHAILVHDNEPHHEVIARKVLESIEAGFKVVIWPRAWPKDVNDMVRKFGRKKVERYMVENVVQGPAAKFRWMRWQKL